MVQLRDERLLLRVQLRLVHYPDARRLQLPLHLCERLLERLRILPVQPVDFLERRDGALPFALDFLVLVLDNPVQGSHPHPEKFVQVIGIYP